MSMNTVSYIELGKIAPKIDTLNKIANFLNVDIAEFFIFCGNVDIENKNSKKIEKIVKKLEKLNEEKINKIDKIVDIL